MIDKGELLASHAVIHALVVATRRRRANSSNQELGAALLKTFDLIQIINLKERRDRRAQMVSELRRLGLVLDQTGVELIEASRFADHAGFSSPGARGCFDSHLRALRRARELGARSTLILEDDCDFSNEIRRTLPSALTTLHGNTWSVFYGGYVRWSQHGAEMGSPIAHATPRDSFIGAHFIALASEAVKHLVPFLTAMQARPPGSPEGGPMHVDGAYDWFRAAHPHLQTWVANPVLGHQRPSRSDIHRIGAADRTLLVRDLVSLTRRMRRGVGKLVYVRRA
jgi:glycosyl transferase, family 25